MLEAVRLVQEEDKTITFAAKTAGVPRMTLNDRLRRIEQGLVDQPKLGRQQGRLCASCAILIKLTLIKLIK